AYFDARAFNVPSEDEIINNLIWRQRDAIKNSVSSWARNFFSDRELHGKNTQERIDMIKESEPSYDWNSLRDGIKYGLIAYKKPYVKVVDGSEVTRTMTEAHAAPIISENKE